MVRCRDPPPPPPPPVCASQCLALCLYMRVCAFTAFISQRCHYPECWQYVALSSRRWSKLLNVKVVLVAVPVGPWMLNVFSSGSGCQVSRAAPVHLAVSRLSTWPPVPLVMLLPVTALHTHGAGRLGFPVHAWKCASRDTVSCSPSVWSAPLKVLQGASSLLWLVHFFKRFLSVTLCVTWSAISRHCCWWQDVITAFPCVHLKAKFLYVFFLWNRQFWLIHTTFFFLSPTYSLKWKMTWSLSLTHRERSSRKYGQLLEMMC